MEAKMRWMVVTALAPVAWGSNYFVTREFLPVGHPLYGAAWRALPAGLVLLALCRRRPRGAWWGKAAVLGLLNVSVFFTLVYLSSQTLPTSLASTVMAASAPAMMLMAWLLVAERPRLPHLAGAGVGLVGVCLMLLTGTEAANATGVLASIAAMLAASCGHVLTKRWAAGADVLAATAWQLTVGGLLLLPAAVAVEGAPPALTAPAFLAFAYVALIATALAFTVWFAGLRHLPAGTVGLLGLLNPVTGVLLGTVVASETLTVQQVAGLALVLAGVVLGRPARAERRGDGREPVALSERADPSPPERADRSLPEQADRSASARADQREGCLPATPHEPAGSARRISRGGRLGTASLTAARVLRGGSRRLRNHPARRPAAQGEIRE